MKISKKLLLIVLLTITEVSITIGAVYEITQGASFHQLNILHMKFNAKFTNMLIDIRNGGELDTKELRTVIKQVRQQPLDCLAMSNVLNKFVMRQIGTYNALEICTEDIEYANTALKVLDKFAAGELNRDSLLGELEIASAGFKKSSDGFEKPIAETVSFIFRTMIPLIIFISLFNILFIGYLSKSISSSIRNVIKLLSEKNSEIDLDEQIEKNVTGELRDLLLAARQRIKNDLSNKEINLELEKLVENRTASLQQANDELAQFSYRASHDLKAPLTSAKGLAKYIKKDIESGNLDEAKANSQKVFEQMERLERLVVDILSLAKADLENSNAEEIDVAQIILEVKNRLSWLFDKNDIDLVEEIDLSATVIAEKARISQIIENLLSNCVKYKDSKKEKPFIKIKVFDNPNEYTLLIEDNGLGIPADRKEQVFKMFKRFHPNVSSGSGLGLSIIKKHVDYMCGQISFDSSENGTIFTIQLPKKAT